MMQAILSPEKYQPYADQNRKHFVNWDKMRLSIKITVFFLPEWVCL